MKINENKNFDQNEHIKVSILEDDIEYRESLKKILFKDPRIHLYGEYSSPFHFINSFNSPFKPDVCLVDIVLPGDMSGIECCKIIKEKYPNIHIIIMTSYPDTKYLVEANTIGADFIEKGTRGEILIDKIVGFAKNGKKEQFISLQSKNDNFNPIELIDQINSARDHISQLSELQRKVLKLKIEGKTSNEIGISLKMNPRTVRTHLRRAYQKLKLPDLLKYINLK